jgi:hypothetical protein
MYIYLQLHSSLTFQPLPTSFQKRILSTQASNSSFPRAYDHRSGSASVAAAAFQYATPTHIHDHQSSSAVSANAFASLHADMPLSSLEAFSTIRGLNKT